MVSSLNNSSGVLGALKSLQTARRELSGAENRTSSGLKVAGAADDAVGYHTASAMKSEGSSLNAVTLSLGRAKSVSDLAIAGGEQVSSILIQMRETAARAMGTDLTNDQRNSYAVQFETMKEQLTNFIRSASFDDANLLDGSKPNGVSFIADADATQTLLLEGRDFRLGNGTVTLSANQGINSEQDAKTAYEALGDSIAHVGEQLTLMAAENKRVDAQMGFVGKLADALAAGVGRLVDTDLAAESALIQALQVKQELSAQAIGIANNAPQALLALFRPS